MTLAWDWERTPDLLVAVLLSFIGLLVLSTRLRSLSHQLFAVFLFLVAGNFLGGVFVAASSAWNDPRNPYNVARFVFLCLDPPTLAAFAAVYPQRARWARPPVLAGLFAVPLLVLAILVAAPDLVIRREPGYWTWTLFLYMAACYSWCLARFAFRAARTPTPLLQQQHLLLLVALGVALVPRLGLIVSDLALVPVDPSAAAVAARSAVAWSALAVLFALAMRWAPAGRRARLAPAFGGMASVLALINAIWVLDLRGVARGLFVTALGYSARWVVFSTLVGVALLRYELLDYRTRRRDAALLGLAFVGVVFLVLVVPGLRGTGDARVPTLSGMDAVWVLLTALGIGTAPLFFSRVARAHATDGAGGPLHDRRLRAYQALLETLEAEGRADDGRPELRLLRQDLGITMREHERLRTLVRWQHEAGGRAGERMSPVARFDVQRPLGEGSWGQAYLARERATGRSVVLKRLRSPFAEDEDARRRLLAEADTLRRIRHPNVVALLDVIRGPEPILVLEYVEGGSLEDRLATNARLSIEETVRLGRAILAGLAEIHDRGVIHRDLKPANILLGESGTAKICDFGLARAVIPSRTRHGGPLDGSGSPQFMSPEQAGGRSLGPASDLYAVAAILYRCLTGRPHVELAGVGAMDALRRISNGPSPPPDGGMGPTARRFFRRGLALRPQRRFASASEMGTALDELRIDGAAARRQP